MVTTHYEKLCTFEIVFEVVNFGTTLTHFEKKFEWLNIDDINEL